MKWLATSTLLVALSLPTLAQTLINVGGPAVGNYAGDSGCTGALWGPSNDPTMGNLSNIYQTLRYSTYFTCSYSVPNGYYSVTLDFVEPNKMAAGQRKFTVTVNGLTTQSLDLFALVGFQIPYQMTVPMIVVNGTASFQFTSTVGNAVVSGIEIQPQLFLGPQGNPGPTGQTGPSGPPGITEVIPFGGAPQLINMLNCTPASTGVAGVICTYDPVANRVTVHLDPAK